jgi:hypothetical protein
MARAAILARSYADRSADLARMAIVLACAGALTLAERAFPLF